ncbi:MAG: hypothetical protein ACRDJW_02430 [Thermomicrobiales bacterium]
MPTHPPFWHVSPVVQGSPSLHIWPLRAGLGWLPQIPAAQVAVRHWGIGQAASQAPQCSGPLAVSTQSPSQQMPPAQAEPSASSVQKPALPGTLQD